MAASRKKTRAVVTTAKDAPDAVAALRAAITALQHGADAGPTLFPHGITRISIAINPPGWGEVSLTVEGPQTGPLAEDSTLVSATVQRDGKVGCDTAASTLGQAACLRAAVGFVARYLARPGPKVITRAEALALTAAGVQLVSVWEDGEPIKVGYFDRAKGEQHGKAAYALAEKLGQPKGTPIYFAVDYDAEPSDLSGPIAAYFDGVAAGLARAASASTGVYPIGVYGSGRACRMIKGGGRARYSWLANAPKWAERTTYGDWNIKQNAGQTICGLSVDGDVAVADFGGYLVT